jgi:hypothetical protein
MPLVFISHSTLDAEFVEKEIITTLRGHGVDVWYSKYSIETAAEWERRIRHGLSICDWFLVVLSPRAVASDWVRSEVHWALEKRKDKVIPVIYEECDPTDLHLKLGMIQRIDFREGREVARRKLLAVWGPNSDLEMNKVFSKAATAAAPPPPKREARKAVFWAGIAAAALLGLGAVWGITKLSGVPAPDTDANVAAKAAKKAEDDEIIEVPRLSIIREESRSYEPLNDDATVLGVHIMVDNLPSDYVVMLADREANIDDDKEVGGGQNRRKIFATIPFAAEVERMKRTRQPLRLPIEVFENQIPENSHQVAIWIDPKKLGLNEQNKPVKRVSSVSDRIEELKQNRGTIKKRRADVARPSPTPSTR